MMKYINVFCPGLLSLCILALTACGGGEESSSTDPDPDPDPQTDPVTPLSVDERPASWLSWEESISAPIYQLSSMTITCDATGIDGGADTNDILAAFINDECRECATPTITESGDTLFFMTVHLTNTDNVSADIPVTYRYYSSKNKHIYSCGPISFYSKEPLGSVASPYHFYWEP